jgi:hypothetical protein
LQHLSPTRLKNQVGRRSLKNYVKDAGINLLTKPGNHFIMLLADYKTVKKKGIDRTSLEEFPFLCQLMDQYLDKFRPVLLKKSSTLHDYLFLMPNNGQPYSSDAWNGYITSLLEKHTGYEHIGTNLIRSSFISTFYGSDDGKDQQMRER